MRALGFDQDVDHRVSDQFQIILKASGEKSREVMSVEDVLAIKARSRSGNSGPWVSDFSEMAKKTVIRRHSKRLPLSTDIDGVLKEDDELFMPEPAAPEAAQADEKPSAARRPSRLQKVAEQAPEPAVHADDDGVIVHAFPPTVCTERLATALSQDFDSRTDEDDQEDEPAGFLFGGDCGKAWTFLGQHP